MKELSNELKSNLIADVENICEMNLSEDTKIALARCFEITLELQPVAPEADQPHKSAEEILEEHKDELWSIEDSRELYSKKSVLRMMEEYASKEYTKGFNDGSDIAMAGQHHEIPEIEDENIFKQDASAGMIIMAKCYREELKRRYES